MGTIYQKEYSHVCTLGAKNSRLVSIREEHPHSAKVQKVWQIGSPEDRLTLCAGISLSSLSRRYKKFEKSCSSKLISVFGQNRTKNYKNTFFLPASPRVLNHLRSLCTVVCSDRSRKKSIGLKIILSNFQMSWKSVYSITMVQILV